MCLLGAHIIEDDARLEHLVAMKFSIADIATTKLRYLKLILKWIIFFFFTLFPTILYLISLLKYQHSFFNRTLFRLNSFLDMIFLGMMFQRLFDIRFNILNIFLFLHCDKFLILFFFCQVICSLCETEQDVSICFFFWNKSNVICVKMCLDADLWFVFLQVQQNCSSCGVCMGKYFCSKCKFFDDDVSFLQILFL